MNHSLSANLRGFHSINDRESVQRRFSNYQACFWKEFFFWVHSQIIWAITSYLLFNLLNKHKKLAFQRQLQYMYKIWSTSMILKIFCFYSLKVYKSSNLSIFFFFWWIMVVKIRFKWSPCCCQRELNSKKFKVWLQVSKFF